ncbi:hypothetical protein M427DRAFT_63576 [Gonapodya prolifera JEL478]|uniref:Uncharacterized protein n=1 Tax=Gonapodya prolifera (strain JEL478) TaxID=1344416 RepID=A0A138ZYV0_GONPJ|nr:hypothetical protein M427DRAFT_63576 [Gonapodya prolifera JEL478]|eukprot:KXS09686.1 hypothetical protein M427DRAFT_63576 [Gonapodya prolifera JEL478]
MRIHSFLVLELTLPLVLISLAVDGTPVRKQLHSKRDVNYLWLQDPDPTSCSPEWSINCEQCTIYSDVGTPCFVSEGGCGGCTTRSSTNVVATIATIATIEPATACTCIHPARAPTPTAASSRGETRILSLRRAACMRR